jgi:hypothetical protein
LEHNPEGIELPPEIEAQMLDQILAFEKVKNEAKEVEIFLYLGRPKIKSAEQLTTEEIILEKERLLKLMSKKGIFLTSIEDVDDKVMYKFITEEFMYKKNARFPDKRHGAAFCLRGVSSQRTIVCRKNSRVFVSILFW